MEAITVTVREDPSSGVWYVAESTLPGLNVEAATYEALRTQVRLAIEDLLEGGDGGTAKINVPVELIAHAQLHIGSDA